MSPGKDARKDKLEKKLLEILSTEEKRLLTLIGIETRKDKLLFRMPRDVISLEGIWVKIKAIALDLKIAVVQTDPYATVAELDDVLKDVKWLWKDWLPRGFVTMLVGDPGIGKSMLVLDLVDIVMSGKSWPTSENNDKPSCVIWIDTEASQQLLRMRAIKMKIDRNRLYIPVIDGDILGQVDVMNEEHQAVILDMIDNLEPALVVIDSLGGSHTRGENKFEDIAPIMQFFAYVARDKNIAVLMTHHLNKGMAGDTTEINLYRIRGSTAIPQFSRSIMALEKLKDDEVRLRMIKSNLSRRAEPLSVKPVLDSEGDIIEMNYGEYKAPPEKKTKVEACASWVMFTLRSAGGNEGYRLRDLIEVAEVEGYTRGNIYSAKTHLSERIYTKGTGREAYWFLNDGKNDETSIQQIVKARRKEEKHDGKKE